MHFNRYLTPVILAGGMGRRLQKVMPYLPKVLAPVKNRSFITYIFDQIVRTGFDEVVLCVGHKAETIIESIGKKYKDLSIRYSKEPVPLGTGGAIRNALSLINTDHVLLMNGDSFIDDKLIAYIIWHFQNKYEASLILTHVPDTSRYGRVVVDDSGIIRCFEEKSENHGNGWINSGVYTFKTKLLLNIPPNTFSSLEKEFLPLMVEKNLYGYKSHGRFIDIGTPESYRKAEVFFN